MKGYLGCESTPWDGSDDRFCKCDDCVFLFGYIRCNTFRERHDAKLGYVVEE
jgi:hypothetical protein